MYRATQDLLLNAARTAVVPASDPTAMFLLAGSGSEVTDDDVRKYGLAGGKLVRSDDPNAVAATTAPVDDSSIQAALDDQAKVFDASYKQSQEAVLKAEAERDAAAAERDALRQQVAGLETQVKDLQAQLDTAVKAAKK